MPLVNDAPMSAGFPQIAGHGFQANGIISGVESAPEGIPGRLEIQGGWMVSTLDESDELTASGRRSECYFAPNPRGEWWYTWEFRVPEGWSVDEHRFMVMQIHDSPNISDPAFLPRHPTFLLYVERLAGDQLHFVVRVPSKVLPEQDPDGRIVAARPFEIDRVYRLCLHANWQIDNAGFREFFVDDEPLMRHYNTPTTYDDVTGGYAKLGLYRGSAPLLFGRRVAQYRNIKIWSGNDGYQAVMGSAPRPERRLLIA